MIKVKQTTTGHIFTQIAHAINKSNGKLNQSMVVYQEANQVYVMEAGQFYKNFEVIKHDITH